MRAVVVVLLPAAVVMMTGCGRSGVSAGETASATSANAPQNTESGYLAEGETGAAFITWVRFGGEVAGTFSESYYNPSNPTRLRHESSNFTGTIDRLGVNLDLDVGSVWQGTLRRQRLTLWSVNLGGRAHSTLHFHRAPLAAYKAAVAALGGQSGSGH